MATVQTSHSYLATEHVCVKHIGTALQRAWTCIWLSVPTKEDGNTLLKNLLVC